jgi:hypothetical protein
VARSAGSDVGNVAGVEWLSVCWYLRVLGCLGLVLVQLRNCLTFRMPSLMTLSILDSADYKRNRACLPSMCRGREQMPTSTWRLRKGVAL